MTDVDECEANFASYGCIFYNGKCHQSGVYCSNFNNDIAKCESQQFGMCSFSEFTNICEFNLLSLNSLQKLNKKSGKRNKRKKKGRGNNKRKKKNKSGKKQKNSDAESYCEGLTGRKYRKCIKKFSKK